MATGFGEGVKNYAHERIKLILTLMFNFTCTIVGPNSTVQDLYE